MLKEFVSSAVKAQDDPLMQVVLKRMDIADATPLGIAPTDDPRHSPRARPESGWVSPLLDRTLLLCGPHDEVGSKSGASELVTGPIQNGFQVDELFDNNTRWINPIAIVYPQRWVPGSNVMPEAILVRAYDDEGYIYATLRER